MADPVGISVSAAPVMTAAPTWTRLDVDYQVTGWTVDRGRTYELEKTAPGRATITLVDTDGTFDPSQPSMLVDVMHHAAVCLQNPNDSTWSTLFRGYVSSLRWDLHPTERFAHVTLDLVDGQAIVAAAEMVPDGTWGDDVIDGNIAYNEDTELDAVQTRINQVLDEVGWPSSLRSVFTGNVGLRGWAGVRSDGAGIYAPRTSALQVILDAADAEFPDIANVYISGPSRTGAGGPDRLSGSFTFHGRLARFNPDDVQYKIRTWKVGDHGAVAADPTLALVSPPLTVFRDDSHLVTSAIATPQGVADGDIPAQYVTDTTAVGLYGLRTWSAENLLTGNGTGPTTGLEQTRLFADYHRDNYKTTRTRVGQLTFRPQDPDGSYGTRTWRILCGVDISDVIELTSFHFGSSGFAAERFYVEGVHYEAQPGGADHPDVTLTLDVSPAGYYDENPFS